MARGQRKPASDSLTAQRQSAQAPDLSGIEAPRDVTGADALGDFGLRAYDRLYRTRSEWPEGDLLLIVIASRALELIDEAETQLKNEPLMVRSKRGAAITNPLFKLIEVQRATVMRALRDANLRSRDGASTTSPVPGASPSLETGKGGNVADFESWMK